MTRRADTWRLWFIRRDVIGGKVTLDREVSHVTPVLTAQASKRRLHHLGMFANLKYDGIELVRSTMVG